MKTRLLFGCAVCAATMAFSGAPPVTAEDGWVDGPVMAKPDDPRPVAEAEVQAFVGSIGVVKAARAESRRACDDKPMPESVACQGAMIEEAFEENRGMSYARYVEIMTAVQSHHYPELTERVRRAVRQHNAAVH